MTEKQETSKKTQNNNLWLETKMADRSVKPTSEDHSVLAVTLHDPKQHLDLLRVT